MRFFSRAVCLSFVLAVAVSSEVGNITSEVPEVASEFLNVTSEVLDEPGTKKRTYEGYQLVRVTPQSEEHLQVLRFIEKSVDSMWTPVPTELDPERKLNVDMMVNPSQSQHLTAYLNCSSIPFEVVIANIQRSIDTENDEDEDEEDLHHRFTTPDQCQLSTGYNFRQYQPEVTIKSYFSCLARSHSDKAQYQRIGYSFEGRELFLIKIGMPSNRGVKKPVVWIDGGIHAREWISPATVAYITQELLVNAGNHIDILSEYDFYVMPLINPDGYEYSRTYDR